MMPAYYLLLGVLIGAQEVDSLHVSEINIVAQKEDEQQLADVLLFTVAIECLVPCKAKHIRTLCT